MGSVVSHAARFSGFLSTLSAPVTGIAVTTRTNRGAHFVPRSRCSPRNVAKPSGSKLAPGCSSNAAITWSPVIGSGTAYTATAATPGDASEDAFDGRGCEVLGVHSQPVGAAAREVEHAVVVAIREVARPVPTVAGTGGRRRFVVVVPLEAPGGIAAHDLADRGLGVDEPPVGVEPRASTLDTRVRMHDRDVLARRGQTERARRRARASARG